MPQTSCLQHLLDGDCTLGHHLNFLSSCLLLRESLPHYLDGYLGHHQSVKRLTPQMASLGLLLLLFQFVTFLLQDFFLGDEEYVLLPLLELNFLATFLRHFDLEIGLDLRLQGVQL